jgi:hypothetical protein
MLEADYNVLVQHVSCVLRHIWDPLGLGLDCPADEYDSYAPSVVALVRDTTLFETTINAHLARIETEEMCLRPAPARTLRTARALLGLRGACARAPDVLVKQTISQDGLRCLWVFRRPDGLCNYEHAALRHETDENGTYSSWTTAGDGRSGLFATAEAAAHEARAAIDWLR